MVYVASPGAPEATTENAMYAVSGGSSGLTRQNNDGASTQTFFLQILSDVLFAHAVNETVSATARRPVVRFIFSSRASACDCWNGDVVRTAQGVNLCGFAAERDCLVDDGVLDGILRAGSLAYHLTVRTEQFVGVLDRRRALALRGDVEDDVGLVFTLCPRCGADDLAAAFWFAWVSRLGVAGAQHGCCDDGCARGKLLHC